MKLLTVPEAKDRLRLSLPSIYELFRSGALPNLTLGRRRFVREEDLDRFVAERVREGLK